jgi:hypothetical protein
MVNLRSFVRRGDVGEEEPEVGELFPDSCALPVEEDRRLVSASISSRLTLRSEEVGVIEVSRSSVNLEAVMLMAGLRVES